MKKLAYVVFGVIGVVVVAVVVLPRVVGLNVFKPQIVEAVRDATGRVLRIDGDIKLAILPAVELSLGGVHLSNAPDAPEADMISVATVSAKVALWPLISRKLEVEHLVIQEPVVSLYSDAAGRPNWVFESGAESGKPAMAGAETGGSKEPPLAGLVLQDVRIVGGRVSFVDARGGQEIQARDIALTASLAGMASPLVLTGQAVVNERSVSLDVSAGAVAAVLGGQNFQAKLALGSELINAGFAGTIQQDPVPGLDGGFDLEITSVGMLASWLGRPLAADQPDPGSLKLEAVFKAEGAKVALERASLQGEGLEATASGSFDGSGEINKVALKVDAGALDLARYLPPAKPAAAGHAPMARKHRDMTEGISEEPIDLTPLRQTEAQVEITLAGLKAPGIELGRLAFTTTLEGGVLQAHLSELALYGGTITGTLALDGSGEVLGVVANAAIDKVDVGALAAATGDGPPPVSGVASGSLEAKTTGASPKALVENISARLAFDLGGIDVADAPAGQISGIKIDLDLPGLDSPPSLAGQVVYNREPVALSLTLDPLKQVLSGDPFALTAKLDSAKVTLGYDGRVQQEPVPGLDGTLELDIPSVSDLAAWLGQPLEAGQPDPGPLKLRARFAAEGEAVRLEEATIQGESLEAKASGSFDGSGAVKKIVLALESGVLDIDRYLPSPAPKSEAPAAETSATDGQTTAAPVDFMAALSDEPIDLSGLKGTEAEITVALGGIKAAGFEVGRVAFTTRLKDSVLAVELGELGLYGGRVTARLDVNGAGEALAVAAGLQIAEVAVAELAAAATGSPAPISGLVSGSLEAKAQGASPRVLAQNLSAKLAFALSEIDAGDSPAADVSALDVALDLPGLEAPSRLTGAVVYKGEKAALDVTLDPLKQILSGERFALRAALSSALINLGYDGSVQQQPLPGLDGSFDLDVPSVGKLAAWLDQPFDPKQPDPGPLKVHAVLSADQGKVALTEATIVGKSVKARAEGSFDSGQAVPTVIAALKVDELDLDAYLPPQKAGKKKDKGAAGKAKPAPAAQGWSAEPIDLAPLRQINADISIETGSVRYRGLEIARSRATLKLVGGVLDFKLEDLAVADGAVTAAAHLDGSGKSAALDYQASVEGVQALPVLAALADVDYLSGTANLAAKGSARGRSEKELVSSLNGDGRFQVLDGAIEGFDLAATLRNMGSVSLVSGASEKTDFAELSGSYVITKGRLTNQDLQMLAPLVRVNGAGDVNLPPQTLDYGVEAKLVSSLKGQGGEKGLEGLAIPIRATGPWANPAIQIDWASAIRQAALDPKRLKNMPDELQGLATGLGIKLAIPGAEEGGSDQGGETGGAAGVLQQLLNPQPAPQPETQAEGPAPTGPAPTGKAKEEPAPAPSLKDPLKTLKGLFGN
jgi:AsmA protein